MALRNLSTEMTSLLYSCSLPILITSGIVASDSEGGGDLSRRFENNIGALGLLVGVIGLGLIRSFVVAARANRFASIQFKNAVCASADLLHIFYVESSWSN